jgi:hypothetical protein
MFSRPVMVRRTWEGDDLARKFLEGRSRLGRGIFNTHLRWEMMPRDPVLAAVRYIYLVRNAKDACTSFYHHMISQVGSHHHHHHDHHHDHDHDHHHHHQEVSSSRACAGR